MPKQRIIGRIEPMQKVWFSKQELAAYLGVTESYIEKSLNTRPDVKVFRLSERCFLYEKENIDRVVRKSII